MSAKIETRYGEPAPPAPRHSVTVHFPGWKNVELYADNNAAMNDSFNSGYPRMKIHRDIVRLVAEVLRYLGAAKFQGCIILPSLQTAKECVEYATSCQDPVTLEQISIRVLNAKDIFYAVLYPINKHSIFRAYWRLQGCGVSSRFAEANLSYVNRMSEATIEDVNPPWTYEGPVHQELRERIARLLKQAPLEAISPKPASNDVYLFPSGMGAIYKAHAYLAKAEHGTTVVFGMGFTHTLSSFKEFASTLRLIGDGVDQDEDFRNLESYLQNEQQQGRKVTFILTEFPVNSLRDIPDLPRLRALADKYDIILVVDDTVSSWANVDLSSMADMQVTSITKSFNGYADVIAGSAILNPGPRYQRLKALFREHYVPELYIRDAEAIERNSRDYLSRTTKLNGNALAIANYLKSCAQDPESAVHDVLYPGLGPVAEKFKTFMRPTIPDSDFVPGYGCLFYIELEDIPTTIAFYENLNIHMGPHLGAPMTLGFAYAMCSYKNQMEWAMRYGLKPTQIRISAGLEETAMILEDFRIAVEAANDVKRSRATGASKDGVQH